ncbi:MAG: LamB/YcsF family protein [Gilvibacter sp.]
MAGIRLPIPINADLGEAVGNDAQLMPLLTSCNIACGGHAGDLVTMRATALLAKQQSVGVGAHPSFPDRENFGRVVLDMTAKQLTSSIVNQIMLLSQVCDELAIEMTHIKAHGALYNLAANDRSTAMTLLEAIDKLPKKLPLYTLPNSLLAEIAQNEFIVIHEAFLDRKYLSDGSLMPRSKSGSVLTNKADIWAQCDNLYFKNRVEVAPDEFIPLKAQTFCIHGDTPDIYNSLLYVGDQLKKATR